MQAASLALQSISEEKLFQHPSSCSELKVSVKFTHPYDVPFLQC